MGVNGTPAMVLSNGMVLPGYQGPKELKAFLDEHKNRQAVTDSRGNNRYNYAAARRLTASNSPADLPPLLQRLYASRGVRSAQELERSVKGMLPLDAAHRR